MAEFCPRCGSENVRATAAAAPVGCLGMVGQWFQSVAAYLLGFIEFGPTGTSDTRSVRCSNCGYRGRGNIV